MKKFRGSQACFTELNSFRFHSPWFAHRTKHRVFFNINYNKPLSQTQPSAKQHVRKHHNLRYRQIIRKNQSAPPFG